MKSFEQRYAHAVAVAAPQASVRAPFDEAGIATFARERDAIDALAQLADHAMLLARPAAAPPPAPRPVGQARLLNEAQSLAWLARAGIPVIEHIVCLEEGEVLQACAALGGDVVLKACSRDVAHKSEHGLVALGPADPVAEFRRQRDRVAGLGARFEGVIVARRARGGRELALGARLDPQFGPVVLVGDGGIYLEALKDFRLLLPPFSEAEVLGKLGELRIAPLLGAARGQQPRDLAAFARMAASLGKVLAASSGAASVDVNPVMVFGSGEGAVAVDALVEVT